MTTWRIQERAGVRNGSVNARTTTVKRTWNVTGDDVENDAIAFFLTQLGSTVPLTWNGFPISDFAWQELIDADDAAWEFSLTYSWERIPQPTVNAEDWEWTRGTKQATAKASHMLQKYASHKFFESAPTIDTKLAINPQSDGRIEGTDVPVSTRIYTLTGYTTETDFADTYGPIWDEAANRVNQYLWRGFPPRCICFNGYDARGRVPNFLNPTGDLLVKAVLSFEAREPVVGDSIGTISEIDYQGFDVVSQMTREHVDSVSNEKRPFVVQVDVGRVHELYNFSTLGM